MKILSIGEGYDEKNIKAWLNCDSGDPGFLILIDEELIDDLNSKERENEEETESEDICQVAKHILLKLFECCF
ncbi:unnamed protein product [Parnassius apollo]|uniref:(apollo) hypothetical protein n=1 Tax=Parnassius apollo TaxID=110799 RepID=A0A8S3W2D0_PARAO|nr:unnamed protein product [Parnassius apollo]